jgi:hypothetical protein
MEIFEQYFYDLEQFERNPSSDVDDFLEQKIQIFKSGSGEISHGYEIPNHVHKILYVYLQDNQTEYREYLEKRTPGEFIKIKSGSLLNNTSNPIYYIYSNKIFFGAFPMESGRYTYQFGVIKKPKKPNWGYVISGENALFNPSGSTDFELHSSEENKLVIKILALAGVAIKDVQLAQVAAGKEASITQQQKQ